jgi:hypothetical protein
MGDRVKNKADEVKGSAQEKVGRATGDRWGSPPPGLWRPRRAAPMTGEGRPARLVVTDSVRGPPLVSGESTAAYR